jgi:hypothetical protein
MSKIEIPDSFIKQMEDDGFTINRITSFGPYAFHIHMTCKNGHETTRPYKKQTEKLNCLMCKNTKLSATKQQDMIKLLEKCGLTHVSGTYDKQNNTVVSVKCNELNHTYDIKLSYLLKKMCCVHCNKNSITKNNVDGELKDSTVHIVGVYDAEILQVESKYNFLCSKCGEKYNRCLKWMLSCKECPCLRVDSKMAAIDKAVTNLGGKCITRTYNGSKGDYTWKCSNPDHPQWTRRLDLMYSVRGRNITHWCPMCSK